MIPFATTWEECPQEVINLGLESLEMPFKHYRKGWFKGFVTLKALRCQLYGIDYLYLVLAGEDHDG